MKTKIINPLGSPKFKITYPENMFDAPVIIEEQDNPKNKVTIPIDSFGPIVLTLHEIYKERNPNN